MRQVMVDFERLCARVLRLRLKKESRGQFHKTIYDVFSSQKDRTMCLNQNLRFIKIKKFTKFSLSGVNLRS